MRHLERFFYKAQGLSSETPHVLKVCLLVVQCMEVGKDPIYIVLLYEYDISERHSSVNGAAAFLASTLLLKLPL